MGILPHLRATLRIVSRMPEQGADQIHCAQDGYCYYFMRLFLIHRGAGSFMIQDSFLPLLSFSFTLFFLSFLPPSFLRLFLSPSLPPSIPLSLPSFFIKKLTFKTKCFVFAIARKPAEADRGAQVQLHVDFLQRALPGGWSTAQLALTALISP